MKTVSHNRVGGSQSSGSNTTYEVCLKYVYRGYPDNRDPGTNLGIAHVYYNMILRVTTRVHTGQWRTFRQENVNCSPMGGGGEGHERRYLNARRFLILISV